MDRVNPPPPVADRTAAGAADVACDVASGADVGYLAALAGLELMTISRLRVLLARHVPAEAFAVAAGRLRPHPAVEPMLTGELRAAWKASASRRDPDACAVRCRGSGIGAVTAAHASFPAVLRTDPQPPAVLFFRGEWSALGGRRVGVVGTRNATATGRSFAATLGRELVAAGVSVVSGLAKGIDGAAHHGALRHLEAAGEADGIDGGEVADASAEASAGGRHTGSVVEMAGGSVVGVVANGLDEPYPRVHAGLWERVATAGLLISEWPPGTEPERFRFPLRNRLIAALSEVVVVVESRERGGSLITTREALERGVEVMAVPGSVTNRAAAGPNQLLRDGAAPVTEPGDVLVALGLDNRRGGDGGYDPRALPRGVDADVFDLCRGEACTVEHAVAALGLSLSEAAICLARLERSGWVRESGGWFEGVSTWSG